MTDTKVWQALENRDYPLRAYYGTVLKVGSKGTAVVALQKALRITADGAYGPQTQAAVKALQGRAKLARTGVVADPHVEGARGRAAQALTAQALGGHALGGAAGRHEHLGRRGPRESTTEPSTAQAAERRRAAGRSGAGSEEVDSRPAGRSPVGTTSSYDARRPPP